MQNYRRPFDWWANRYRILVVGLLAIGFLMLIVIVSIWFGAQLTDSRQAIGISATSAAATSLAQLVPEGTPSVVPTLAPATEIATLAVTPTDTPADLGVFAIPSVTPVATATSTFTNTPPPSTAVPTAAATQTPWIVTATPSPTDTPLPATATHTSTPSPSVTPVPTALPGVYVKRLLIDPTLPKFGASATFTATFVNTRKAEDTVDWFVEIFDRASNRLIGQTPVHSIKVPVGSKDFSIGGWNLATGDKCVQLYAQPFHLDGHNNPVKYLSEKGETISVDFQICP